MALLVSIGTDGVTDWVKTPDGQLFNLGPVSPLRFVSSLSQGSRQARQALDQFLKQGEALLSVDEDRMWALLAPRRSRWASSSDGPFMAPDHRQHPLTARTEMSTIFENLDRTKKVIAYLDKKAAAGETDRKAFEYLSREAGSIQSLEDSSYYGLGKVAQEDEDEGQQAQGQQEDEGQQAKEASGLTFDTYDGNMKLAKRVLARAQETVATINAKVAAGKRFNAVRARADVHALTTKVAAICESTQLTEDWVRPDLQKLARRSEQLWALFHPKS